MTRTLAFVGGGHAHVYVLKHLASKQKQLKELDVEVVLIAKDIMTPYSGMLPGYIAGHYTYEDIHIDLAKICNYANIRLIHAACMQIIYHSDASHTTENDDGNDNQSNNHSNRRGTCICDNGERIDFDCLSINVGSAPSVASQSLRNNPKVISVKPISEFCNFYIELKERLQRLQQNSSSASASTPIKHRIGVVGGGAGAIEVILSMQHSLQRLLDDTAKQQQQHQQPQNPIELEMVLFTRGTSLLKQHNHSVRQCFQRVLKERNIQVHYSAEVINVETLPDDRLQLKLRGTALQPSDLIVDECLLCTTADGASWLSQSTPFRTDANGFLMVESTYQVVDAPGVFAGGDCCGMVDHPRPKGELRVPCLMRLVHSVCLFVAVAIVAVVAVQARVCSHVFSVHRCPIGSCNIVF
uniref:FAD/NAD(P)-binding domain-containing protein n=1 Tax=Craspedostauros australis TaxID=1486917 RepID=A0A7R9WQM8_9STRA|mmetsp:Transcript_13776/g.37866  ORF Transcript_13776/g.37866 Transcript_13776/m.37866 type:complete len:412 (+) Transcript_13776:280-1515(+)